MNIKSATIIVFKSLTQREKLRFSLAFLLQIALSFVEILAVLCFSILANLIVTQNLFVQNHIVKYVFFDILQFEELDVSRQISFLSIIVITLLVARSVFAAFYLRRLNFFLVRKSVEMQGELLTYLLKESPSKIVQLNKQEMQLTIMRGVSALYTRNLVGLISISSDLILITAVIGGLLIFDPRLTLIMLFFFAIIFAFMGVKTTKFVNDNASEEKSGDVLAKVRIYEILDNYKDFILNSDIDETIKQVKAPLLKQSLSAARLAFVPVFNRYLYEALMLLVIFAMSAIVFSSYETRVALSVLATFILGLTRLIPAALRLQQQLNSIRMVLPVAKSAAELIERINSSLRAYSEESDLGANFSGKDLSLDNVSFYYHSDCEVLSDISIEFSSQLTTVIVGSSGSGKTTLIDLISGVREQVNGRILWNGSDLRSAVRAGRVGIGYVPQEVKLMMGSLKENILMNRLHIQESHLAEVIRICNLHSLVSGLTEGLETQIGDGQRILSGGEIQRIGLARAVVSNPEILILDEFTSSLDTETEAKILKELFLNLKNTVIISVAHRKSAIEKFDRVVELTDGKVTFDGNTGNWLRLNGYESQIG